ncbi:hypothetical protein TGME49_312160 [Toxoplasma gondii ME49]|uniref:Uncharacterized protein n=7 Tax=Toxoplasma gondii TaxID=5811 RepID=B6K8R4_TOXGV|nr:hypothetical protein TGME49_312160 [Toxoplasma gondii ME49]ESS35062.1 hypothetical protein TGVEG_312160 [Toxoplasma gondii VEG]KYF48051.1 hypothetical protein TGARI_312160 [Toxoplasma gondii ARI]PIL98394.1 hypothetical protein TGCOUG_312160 [Toxoplasma gondii COUG]EPT26037.1 hypothetical protein TGME49_312160 [Toxoplasma gondii ME49]CEL77478.1 TPA: hypothetical protein BN1205_096260 [Toxoplasma gondii VEG]|eukprot:XP_002364438.1 hypothetical protein TGME49_312160 [Toxoplasma gondii ME49]
MKLLLCDNHRPSILPCARRGSFCRVDFSANAFLGTNEVLSCSFWHPGRPDRFSLPTETAFARLSENKMLSQATAGAARALLRPVCWARAPGVSHSFQSLRNRFFSSNSTGAVDNTVQMLVAKPRPTQYQTEICNQATNVQPGVEKDPTKGIIAMCVLLFAVPCIHTKLELSKYYSEHGHRYETGWNVFHYDSAKNTYLS